MGIARVKQSNLNIMKTIIIIFVSASLPLLAESLKCYQFGTGSEGNVSLVENPSIVTSANLSTQLTEQNVVTCPVTDTSCVTVEFPENGQVSYTMSCYETIENVVDQMIAAAQALQQLAQAIGGEGGVQQISNPFKDICQANVNSCKVIQEPPQFKDAKVCCCGEDLCNDGTEPGSGSGAGTKTISI